MPRLTREEIKRRLLELSRQPAPEDLSPGAMCYSPAMPPPRDRWTFTCPDCGRRTVYVAELRWPSGGEPAKPVATGEGERHISEPELWALAENTEWLLAAARRLPKRKGIHIDASALCAFCSPGAQRFEPVLEVQLPDEKQPRRTSFTSEDVEILKAFFTGKDRYQAGQGSERALRDEVARLKSLLLGEEEDPGDGGR